MIEEYNRKVANQGIPETEMRAIHSLLSETDKPFEELQDIPRLFDVVLVSELVELRLVWGFTPV